MIEWTDDLKKQFQSLRVIAFAMLVGAPIAYILVAFNLSKEFPDEGGEFDIMFYILLFLAMTQPIIIPLIEKFQILNFKKNPKSPLVHTKAGKTPFGGTRPEQGTPMGLYMVLTIIKSAIIEAVYIYGLVILFVSGDLTRMFYFYPVGIAWTIIYFPTKERCKIFLEKVSSNAIV